MCNAFDAVFGPDGFDATTAPARQSFEAIPPGPYTVLFDKAEIKPTKSGNGHYVEVQMSVIGGPFANRKLWDRINVDNPSAKCVEIGMAAMGQLATAIGLVRVRSTDEIIGKMCLVKVKVKNDSNEIAKYEPLGGAGPGAPANPTPRPSAPVNGTAPPAPQPNAPSPSPGGASGVNGKTPWDR
jgi:hypothetical protein